jgi:UDP-N-acetylglucosamine:LPS N-acetylglucosamine transferase
MTHQLPFDSLPLPASPLSLSPTGFLKFYTGFRKTEKQVHTLILDKNIDCVLSTGGFVAAPALKAARRAACPTVLLNIDSPPGKANRLAVRWADTVLSTVESALQGAQLISPPLRRCVLASSFSTNFYEHFGLDQRRMTLLVTGASQGAATLNGFVPELARLHPTQFLGWQVLHIAGTENVAEVNELWSQIEVPCSVVDFVDDMGLAWGVADLAITRGGANTIAEIAANAVPSIVMPYPYHKDQHQKMNAQPLEVMGGIRIEEDYIRTPLNLLHAGITILGLLKNHQARFAMKQAMIENAVENGAKSVAHACIASIGR